MKDFSSRWRVYIAPRSVLVTGSYFHPETDEKLMTVPGWVLADWFLRAPITAYAEKELTMQKN